MPTVLAVQCSYPSAKLTMKALKKKALDHPAYADMVMASISALAERKGSSRVAILNYVLQNYNVGDDSKKVNLHVNNNLKKGADTGLLVRVSGVGANGRFRLGEAAKAPNKKVAKTSARSPKKATITKLSKKVVGKKIAVENKKTGTTAKTAKSDSAKRPKTKSLKKVTAKSTKTTKAPKKTQAA
ncbi:unnamed protein product, partial [Mesorhabditis belari]|uniref:H15 domain-containing protein n=1 Tax=Mesorhabditis belari TaxID=2138241 RepID=A0AAF3EBX1_9BILA